jgi:PAS domain S-box-containing protein
MIETSKKIIVIDDNEDNLLALYAIITDMFSGFAIYTSSDGPGGIELAKKHQPDLILLDILMPGMDGYEVCSILKQDENLREIPVVFVTAMRESRENKIRALETGAEGFLTKPIDVLELVAQIKAMLKIKEANDFRKSEKLRLEELVNERTRELKKIEELHLESQAIAHLGHWVIDLRNNQLDWSDEVYRIFGLVPQQHPVNNEIFTHFIHPDDRNQVEKAYRSSIEQRTPYETEHRIVLNNGNVKYVYEKAVTYYDESGIPKHSIGTVIDITERVQMEQRLRDTISQRDALAKHIPGVIYQFRLRPDGSSHFPYASEGIRDIYGISPEQAEEDAGIVFNILHPDDRNRVNERILESARTLSIWHDKYRVNLPNGKNIWVEGESTPQQMIDGSILWHGYIRDITEQKRFEIAQRTQLNISRSIINANNLNELLGIIRTELNKLFDTTNFFVARYNPQTETLKQVFFADENDRFEEWPAGQTFSGQVIKTAKTIFLKGEAIDIFREQHKLKIQGTVSACWIGIPIFVKSQVTGVIVIQHYTNPNAYSESDVVLLETIAHEIGIYMERQMMIEDLFNAINEAEQNNANIKAIIEGTHESIWAFDNNYIILYINNTFRNDFEASFGVHLDKGINLLKSLPKPLQSIWKSYYDRALTNKNFSIVDEVETALGTQYIEVTFSPILKDGFVIGGFCFGTNITKRKQAEVKIMNQLNELKRWHDVMLDREERIIELKREINKLAISVNQPLRYPDIENENLYT